MIKQINRFIYKFTALFLLLCFFNFINPLNFVWAQENIKNTDLQIKKDGNRYGLVDLKTGKAIFNTEFSKIKINEIENTTVIIASKGNYNAIYSSDGTYSGFLKKYIEYNNKFQNIKFYNYPQNGAILYRHNRIYGLIYADDDYIIVLPPIFREIRYPDENSIISHVLGISFADKKDIVLIYDDFYSYLSLEEYLQNAKFHDLPAKVKLSEPIEDVKINNSKMIVEYKGCDFSDFDTQTVMKKDKGFKLFNKKENQYSELLITLKAIEIPSKNETLFLAKKNGKYVVNINNEEIVPFTVINIFDDKNEKFIKAAIKKQINKYNTLKAPFKLFEVLYCTIFGVLALPFAILTMPMGIGNIINDEFSDEYDKYDYGI